MPLTKKHKLGPKTVDCVLLGYAFHSIGYRLLIVKSKVPDMYVDTIIESRDVTFFEEIVPMKEARGTLSYESILTQPTIPLKHVEQPFVEHHEEEHNDVSQKSKRQRIAKSFGDYFIVYLVDDTPKTIEEAYAS